jgi:signal transduction histidine kinase
LGNFGVKINSQKLLKQQLELTVPKPGGTTGKVEIDIRGLKPEEIIDKITEAVIYVPDENLEFIYNRFIKGTDDDTKTSNTGLGG